MVNIFSYSWAQISSKSKRARKIAKGGKRCPDVGHCVYPVLPARRSGSYRSVLASKQCSTRTVVKETPFVPLKQRRICENWGMLELDDEVDPIVVGGNFHTWDKSIPLSYTPLPPPPRKPLKRSQLERIPRYHERGVCMTCSPESALSCSSAHLNTTSVCDPSWFGYGADFEDFDTGVRLQDAFDFPLFP